MQATLAYAKLFMQVSLAFLYALKYSNGSFTPNSIVAAHESINSHTERLRQRIFEMVSNQLADGRSYLVGDRFSAADLAFATLAAAVVLTPGYGVKLPALEQLPDRMANGIRQFQETLAGKFVLRLYQEYEDEIN